MPNNETLFVFVHDAWLGAWSWEGMLAHLEERERKGVAIDLPGHGAEPPSEVPSLAGYAAKVVEAVKGLDADQVVLIGHGTAGPVLQLAMEQLAGNQRPKPVALVFMECFILGNGESILDNMPPGVADFFRQLADSRPDRAVSLADLPDYWHFNLINDDQRNADALFPRLVPEPIAPWEEKVFLSAFFSNPLPCVYISFNEDMSLPTGEYHPRMANKLGNYRHFKINAGHEGPLTKPREVAEALIFLTSPYVEIEE